MIQAKGYASNSIVEFYETVRHILKMLCIGNRVLNSGG